MVYGQVHIAPYRSRVAYGPSVNLSANCLWLPARDPVRKGSYGLLLDLRSVTKTIKYY